MSRSLGGYIPKQDTRILSDSKIAVFSPAKANEFFATGSDFSEHRRATAGRSSVPVTASPVSPSKLTTTKIRREPRLADYEADFKDFEAMQTKIDALLGPTADKTLVEEEYNKMLHRKESCLRTMHQHWESTVYKPVQNNVRAQMRYKDTNVGQLESIMSEQPPSIAATKLYASAMFDSVDEDLLRAFHGISATAPKLRSTLDGSKWKTQTEILSSEAGRPGIAPKTTSTVPFDHFSVNPPTSRDAVVEREFPRGKRTYTQPKSTITFT